METNACLGCRFGSIKVDISVPEKYDFTRFAKETKAFASDIAVAARQKPIHYSLTMDPEKRKSSLDFTVNCQCILNVKKTDCSNYNPSKTCRIKHLHHSRAQVVEVTQRI